MDTNYIGQRVRRLEDKRFVTGQGQYTEDITLPNMLYAKIIRSPHAHAKIISINTFTASKTKGVVAIYTGKDIADDGITGVPCGWQVNFKNGDTMKEPPHSLLAVDKVLHVGDSVVVVIATSSMLAEDACEKIKIKYEILPHVTDSVEALTSEVQVHDCAPNNLCFDWELGNPHEEVLNALKNSHHITTLEFRNQRLIPNAIEPRAVIGDYNSATGKYTLYTTSQNPHLIRLLVCVFVLNIPEHMVRVIAPDVGGGFGSKIFHYTEEALIVWASKKLKRPIKWVATRSESFMTDAQGRDHFTKVKMGFDKEGIITGLDVDTVANLGAYLSTFAPAVPTWLYGTLLQGLYTTPKIHVNVTAIFTNTTPVDAYRGAGRPEATYLLERMIDLAAHEMDIEPTDLRRKNFIPPFDGKEQPGYETQVALQYDSGNYLAALEKAMNLLNYKNLNNMKDEALKKGNLLGVGYSSYIEACGIAPSAVVGALGARAGLFESALVRVHPSGKVSVFSGSHSHGQGHETTFAQIVADKLGIPIEDVVLIHGDSDSVAFGMGTYGSRSLAVGGTAIVKSIDKIIAKGKKIAAHKLEADESDIIYQNGHWLIKGTDKKIGFSDVAMAAYVPHDYPENLEPGLDFSSFYDPKNFTFPYGVHIAVVEIIRETGQIILKQFISCDDVGNIINPMIVEGQLHGGIAQGVGQALLEGAVYDETGQLSTGSYMTYTMPRADNFPSFELENTVTPCPHNPLGAKGAGEAGTIGSTPAVVNAVIDALWPETKTKDISMPITSEKVWKILNHIQ